MRTTPPFTEQGPLEIRPTLVQFTRTAETLDADRGIRPVYHELVSLSTGVGTDFTPDAHCATPEKVVHSTVFFGRMRPPG